MGFFVGSSPSRSRLLAYGLFEAGWLRTRVLEVEIDGLPAAPRRPPDRAPLRLPPRRALARARRDRARGRLGCRAAARSRLHHRRPRLPSPRRAAPRAAPRAPSTGPTSCSATTMSRSRAIRSRARPSSTASRIWRCCCATRRWSSNGRVSESRSSAPTPRAIRSGRRGPGSSSTRRPVCGSCSATSPTSTASSPTGAFHLVLAGHLHAGQIAIPSPRGRITLAHPGSRFVAGLYPAAGGVMHVSAGTGTTFVPIRFFARPEVTELVLRAANPRLQQSP